MTDNAIAHTAKQCMRVSDVLARVGDKWSVLVIAALGERPYRFNELKRAINGGLSACCSLRFGVWSAMGSSLAR